MEKGWNDLFQGSWAPWGLRAAVLLKINYFELQLSTEASKRSFWKRIELVSFVLPWFMCGFAYTTRNSCVFLPCFITFNNTVSVCIISFPSEGHSRGLSLRAEILGSLQLLWQMCFEALIHCGFVVSLKLFGGRSVSVLCPKLCSCHLKVSAQKLYLWSQC